MVEGIEQRLYAEPIARREEGPIPLVPEHKCEFAAQSMQALGANVFVEMQGDFAVRPSAQMVPRLLEFLSDRFIAVELTVDDDVNASVLARDRLISRNKVNDAEPRVPETNSRVGCDPTPLSVGT